ncbi:hypothetical protein IC229_27605 [Spirosoma sp. BT702]|uniref:Uncharacterized protein n=1 Tax=Spirosoma profusum TaxID=2771354 RepID=A0A926Y0P1_9BACT|nr:hypothetical protein [Spirosoma profusum]MBD2704438.1 hypothetical protein [Spirosoma profusum]
MFLDLEQLTADVKAALEAGKLAADAIDDGGACNMDGVVLSIPMIRERKVVEALAKAGVTTNKGDWGWCGRGYMINPTSDGQANKRHVASEAIGNHLRDAGYDATNFYLMD